MIEDEVFKTINTSMALKPGYIRSAYITLCMGDNIFDIFF